MLPEWVYFTLLLVAALGVLGLSFTIWMDRQEIGSLELENQRLSDVCSTELRVMKDDREITSHSFSFLYMLAKTRGGMMDEADGWQGIDTAYGTMRISLRLKGRGRHGVHHTTHSR